MANDFHKIYTCNLSPHVDAFNSTALNRVKIVRRDRHEEKNEQLINYHEVGLHIEKCRQLQNLLNFQVDLSSQYDELLESGRYNKYAIEHFESVNKTKFVLPDFYKGSTNVTKQLLLQCPKGTQIAKTESFNWHGWRSLFEDTNVNDNDEYHW